MKAEEIELIQSKHNAAIIAPAGHGKTEMITDLVDKLPGRKLVLTHTNAGVSALQMRLDRKKVGRDKYSLSTISAFCMKWCGAYPHTAKIDTSIQISDKGYFRDQTRGASLLFSYEWARKILEETYSCVIVDEYQDCVVEQHQIFLEINKSVPVYVLGDPLQSIFGWAGEPVSWTDLSFEEVHIETKPYRWAHTNPALGKYLTDVRDILLPAMQGNRVRFPILSNGIFIKRITTQEAQGSFLLNEMKRYSSALYLTKWPDGQCAFSQKAGGLFQNDEPQSLPDINGYAQSLDIGNGAERVKAIFAFIKCCSTHVSPELGSYENHIRNHDYDFSKITKHKEFGERLLRLLENNTYDGMLSVLEWIKANSAFRLYRKELFNEMIRSIRFARDRGTTINDAAGQIRMIPSNQSKYSNFKMLSSRTVLSKGLEFECVAIDSVKDFTATDMYVAMTRATRMIYIISDSDSVWLKPPQKKTTPLNTSGLRRSYS